MTASGLVRAGQFNQASRQGAYILIALALPRLGVSRELIGEWETLLFLGFLLGFGWTSGLLQGFLVQMGVLTEPHAGRFSRTAVQVMAGISALILGSVALLRDPFFALLQIETVPVGWYLFFLLLLSRWPSYCFEQALLLRGQARALIVYAVINAAGLLLSLLLPLYLGASMLQAMQVLGAFAGAKVVAVLLWTLLPRRASTTVEPNPTSEQFQEWMKLSRPLVAYASVAALVTAADPWVVNYWYDGDPEVFALFRYGVRELPLLAALISGMTVVAIPLITRDRAAGLLELRKQSRKVFHYLFLLALAMMLTADSWWTRVFTPTFADSLPIFRTFLLVVGCRVVFAMSVLTALTQTRQIYLWGVLELAVNIVLSLLLAPRYGLVGIVWGTVLASYFHEACLVLYLRYRTGIRWREFADLRWYFAYVTALFAAYYWMQ
ncbi:hypothetical protein LEM8419_00114 [Neolewinella maritima]|uniref:Polysaccharide biosynthesis protein C-terminal domain-containing protein n=1 Tax=Neolewinella maritima TaxID=1383882 RepID=A0ABM9AVZ3_9BACT|nr:polysaccharide biosynthesis C-terminal domain-containing protein [Neolewinella maritima]CAH0998768.1 hypothetical protein LEM8419_00114 [Neolewinella maritima]